MLFKNKSLNIINTLLVIAVIGFLFYWDDQVKGHREYKGEEEMFLLKVLFGANYLYIIAILWKTADYNVIIALVFPFGVSFLIVFLVLLLWPLLIDFSPSLVVAIVWIGVNLAVCSILYRNSQKRSQS